MALLTMRSRAAADAGGVARRCKLLLFVVRVTRRAGAAFDDECEVQVQVGVFVEIAFLSSARTCDHVRLTGRLIRARRNFTSVLLSAGEGVRVHTVPGTYLVPYYLTSSTLFVRRCVRGFRRVKEKILLVAWRFHVIAFQISTLTPSLADSR